MGNKMDNKMDNKGCRLILNKNFFFLDKTNLKPKYIQRETSINIEYFQ